MALGLRDIHQYIHLIWNRLIIRNGLVDTKIGLVCGVITESGLAFANPSGQREGVILRLVTVTSRKPRT